MNTKLVVILFCLKTVVLRQIDYCKICRNHTLCKYTNIGPSESCVGYDTKALLTDSDIREITNRINSKRNFIALKYSKYLPGAANMRKIEWSNELAVIAQRWADQCDPSILPDKQDECRDTENFNVGQNIATVTGLTRDVNVKSFVDIWFIESLEYVGNVSFYNRSQNYETNYFTQLIWADTDRVGCGKVRFYVNKLRTILIERLVCNFRPKGNIDGNPIYIIGYPSTRCPMGMKPDSTFRGLCAYKNETKVQSKLENFNDRNVQRITRRNLTGKYENAHKSKRKKKHGDIKNSYAAVKRSHGNADLLSDPKIYKNIEEQERGHSRVHYNPNIKLNSVPHDRTQEWRKYNQPSLLQSLSQDKNNFIKKCTRGYTSDCNDLHTQMSSNAYWFTRTRPRTHECTRDQRTLCYSTKNECTPDLCPCFSQSSKFNPTSIFCYQNPNMLRMLDGLRNKKNTNYFLTNLYTSSPDMGIKNGLDFKEYQSRLKKDAKLKSQNNIMLDDRFDQNYSGRLERQSEDAKAIKPFWKMDDLMDESSLQLKTLKYTTLGSKRNRHRTTKFTKTTKVTEDITINRIISKQEKPLTEKYLSFDELLHLRKFNNDNNNFRRNEKDKSNVRTETKVSEDSADTTAANTTEYTANTPFKRLKHCTRKLTCTWTVTLPTDSAGNERDPNANSGHRTPPGYVEGCTRTSTCTRDYMQRNKMATLSTEPTESLDEDNINEEDSDYCERRSLNKRHAVKKNIITIKLKNNINPDFFNDSLIKINKNIKQNDSRTKFNNLKTDQVRNYRNVEEINNKKDILSYGDLYYLVIQRFIESLKKNKNLNPNHKCVCNNGLKIEFEFVYLFIFVTLLSYKR